MIYITNLLNHLKEWNILEYYHKDIATKIAEQCLQHYGKRNLDEEVEPNLNISEDENQRGKISNSQ